MIERVSIPISTCAARREFLEVMLHSLKKHSRRSHEVIAVTEDEEASIPVVPGVRMRVVRAGPLTWRRGPAGGYNPVYQFLNIGALLASEPWILTPAGDDSYFPPDWEHLLNAVEPSEGMGTIWVPRYMATMGPPGNDAERRKYAGPHGGESRGEYRIYPNDGEPFIRESTVIHEAQAWADGSTVRERAGDRHVVSWPHAVIYRELFAEVGGYRTIPPYPDSHDIHLHEAFQARKVTAVGVHRVTVVNSKVPIRLGA